jgi:sporulation protein YlmC with PRC-barrel domain
VPLLSQLLGRPVQDVNGHRIGRLIDLVARVGTDAPYPEVVSLVVRRGRSTFAVPFPAVALLDAPAIPLNRILRIEQASKPDADGLYLARDVLGGEVRDRTGGTMLRVSDLGLEQVRSRLWVTAVHSGGPSSWPCLRAGALTVGLRTCLRTRSEVRLIPWSGVEWVCEDPVLLAKILPMPAGGGQPGAIVSPREGQGIEQGERL